MCREKISLRTGEIVVQPDLREHFGTMDISWVEKNAFQEWWANEHPFEFSTACRCNTTPAGLAELIAEIKARKR